MSLALLGVGAAGASFDPDAQAFITAAGITDGTQKSAINTLVLALKAGSIWTGALAIYPVVGGTATTHKFNLVNPVDSDAAFRITFTGSPTHDANGVQGNGTTQYADTHIIPVTNFSSANAGTMVLYSRSNQYNDGSTQRDMGCELVSITRTILQFGNNTFGNISCGGASYGNGTIADTLGMFTNTRENSTLTTFYQNATSMATSAEASTNRSTCEIGLMCEFAATGVTTGALATRQYCFWAVYNQGLTGAEVTSLYNAVQAFQTSLGRQV